MEIYDDTERTTNLDTVIIVLFVRKVKSLAFFLILDTNIASIQTDLTKEAKMAGSINKVILVGNVGQDPQTRTMQSGQKVVSFSLATSDRWRDKQTGEQKEQTEWHRIVIFSPNLVDVAERMLQKGTKLYIEGALRTRKWQNQQGVDTFTTEVVLNQFSGTMVILSGAKSVDAMSGGSAPAPTPAPSEEISIAEIGDDIPF